MSDRIAVFNDGRVEQVGPPTEIYERPDNAFVAGFVGVSNLLERDGQAVHGPPGEDLHRRERRGARAGCTSRRGRSRTSPTRA